MRKELQKSHGQSQAEAEITQIESYWASIRDNRSNAMDKLCRGTQIIKPGRGYKKLDISPDHLEPIEIPLTEAQESRLIASIHKMSELLEGYKYRRDRETLRILRRNLRQNS